jgi:hypothetical protein
MPSAEPLELVENMGGLPVIKEGRSWVAQQKKNPAFARRGSGRISSDQASSSADGARGQEEDELGATVLGPSGVVVLRVGRFVFAEAAGDDALR